MSMQKIDLKNIDLKNIYEWPLIGRIVVITLVCFGVFYLGYFFDFSGLSDQIYQRYQQEQDLKQQVRSIFKTEEDMANSISQFPEMVHLLNQWQDQLVNGANLPDLLNQILKLGAQNHIKFVLFTPGAKKQQDDYCIVPIKAIVQGHYNQLAAFVSQVANLSQVVVVSDFNVIKPNASEAGKTDESDNVLTAELILEVYYLGNLKKI